MILIEADGAKRYAVESAGKLGTRDLGADGSGDCSSRDGCGWQSQFGKICHRPECVADFLGKETEEKLTEEDIVKIAVIHRSSPKMRGWTRIPCTAE